jgi:pilus assembly protein CpaB
MVNKTLWIRTGLAVSLVIAAAWMFFPKWSGAFTGFGASADDVDVLVASRYLPAYTEVRTNHARLMSMPKEFVPPGAIHTKDELEDDEGRALFSTPIALPEGQPLTRAILVDAAKRDTLSGLIQPGRTAVSFEVDAAHGVGGWVKPGDTVALFRAVSSLDDKPAQRSTRLLLAAIPIVAVDDMRLGQKPEAEKPSEEGDFMPKMTPQSRVLTVVVTPQDASSIIEAREQGALSVVLRAPGDDLPWPSVN